MSENDDNKQQQISSVHNMIIGDDDDIRSNELELLIPKSLHKLLVNTKDIIIDSKIADSKFGMICLGKLCNNNRQVAIKFFDINKVKEKSDETLDEMQMIEKFLWDAVGMYNLNHPSIVQMLGIIITNKTKAIIYEYCSGGDLSEYISEAFEDEYQWLIALQIIEGIICLHNNGRVHHHITADNILFDDDWNAKLGDLTIIQVDFSITAIVKTTEKQRRISQVHRSPEASQAFLQHKPIPIATKEADIFSYGLLLLQICLARKELLTDDMTIEELIQCIADNTILERFNADEEWLLLPVIKKCLKLKPSERPTAQGVRSALLKLKRIKAAKVIRHTMRLQLYEKLEYRQKYYIPNYVQNNYIEYNNHHEIIKNLDDEKIYNRNIIEEINEFLTLENNDVRVLCIYGGSGAGKTTSLQYLGDTFYKTEDKLIVYLNNGLPKQLSMSTLKNGIMKCLKTYGCYSYESLRNEPIVFVLDSYDEIDIDIEDDITEVLGLSVWPKAKLIITCRNNFLLPEKERRHFGALFKTIYLLPFTFEQINHYMQLQNIINNNYENMFNILKNPFLLELYCSCKDTLDNNVNNNNNNNNNISNNNNNNVDNNNNNNISNNNNVDNNNNNNNNISNNNNNNTIQMFDIYNAYLEKWFNELITLLDKGLQNVLGIKKLIGFNKFASNVAYQMYLKQQTEIKLQTSTSNDEFWNNIFEVVRDQTMSLRLREEAKKSHDKRLLNIEEFGNFKALEIRSVMNQSPVLFNTEEKKVNRISFVHRNYQDLFCALHIIQNLHESFDNNNNIKDFSQVILGHNNLLERVGVFDMLANLVDVYEANTFHHPYIINTKEYKEENLTLQQQFARDLWLLIENNRQVDMNNINDNTKVLAICRSGANALSILNHSGCILSGRNFSNGNFGLPIYIYDNDTTASIVGNKFLYGTFCDLSGSQIINCNFTNCNLNGVNLTVSNLNQSKFSNVQIYYSLTCKLPKLITRKNLKIILMTANSNKIVLASLEEIYLYDMNTNRYLAKTMSRGNTALAISYDGKYIVSGHGYSGLMIRDGETLKRIQTIDIAHEGMEFLRDISCISFASDENDYHFITCGADDMLIKKWNINNHDNDKDNEPIAEYKGHQNSVTYCYYAKVDYKTSYIYSGDKNGVLIQFNDKDQTIIKQFNGLTKEITCIIVSDDFKKLYAASKGDEYKILEWNTVTGNHNRSFIGHNNIVRSLCIDGDFLFSAGDDYFIFQFSLCSTSLIRCFKHKCSITSLVMNEQRKILYSLEAKQADGIHQDFIFSRPIQRMTATSHDERMTCMILSKDEEHLYTCSDDLTIKKWSCLDGRLISIMKNGHEKGITCLALSNNNKYLFSGSQDCKVVQWNMSNGTNIKERHFKLSSPITSLCIDNINNNIYCGRSDGKISIIELSSGKFIKIIETKLERINHLFYNQDLLYCCGQGVEIYDKNNFKLLNNLKISDTNQLGIIHRIQLRITNDDDEQLLIASGENSIYIWNLLTNELLKTIKKKMKDSIVISPFSPLAISNDSYFVEDKNGSISHCDFSGKILSELKNTNSKERIRIHDIVCNKDGSRVFSINNNNQIVCWQKYSSSNNFYCHWMINKTVDLFLEDSTWDDTIIDSELSKWINQNNGTYDEDIVCCSIQ